MAKITQPLDTTPYNEPCAQTGLHQHWITLQRLECEVYRAALVAAHGPVPQDVYVSIKIQPHDFGGYAELQITFDPDYPEQQAYAAAVEDGLSKWLDVNFTAPVIYDDIGVVREGSIRPASECVIGALVTSKRLVADGYATAREHRIVANLSAQYPEWAALADQRIATIAGLASVGGAPSGADIDRDDETGRDERP